MELDSFAEYFTTRIPITALVYDNRCTGASDGYPRFELLPSLQMSDLQDAITYAQSLEEVDPEKIALWGTSYSGGNVLEVAAFDHRVKAVPVRHQNSVCRIDRWESDFRIRKNEKNDLGIFKKCLVKHSAARLAICQSPFCDKQLVAITIVCQQKAKISHVPHHPPLRHPSPILVAHHPPPTTHHPPLIIHHPSFTTP
jgi:hypothetical protein